MKTAVIVPCYKRREYTIKCIRALESAQAYKDTTFFLFDDGSNDATHSFLELNNLGAIVIGRDESIGLRRTILEFFQLVEEYEQSYEMKFDLIAKMDNDCVVPENWLRDIQNIFGNADVDILSPNVFPSNAALTHGKDDKDGLGYRPSSIVGGLWVMRRDLIDSIDFEDNKVSGIRGAFSILNQIILEKEPKIGWVESVTVQDLGHWSGAHPEHIKSEDHQEYSAEIGRHVAWHA